MMTRAAVVAVVVLLGLTQSALVTAEPTPNVEARGGGDRTSVELDLNGEETPAAPRPASPSDSVFELAPNCVFGAFEKCAPVPCGDGDREYVLYEENPDGVVVDFETFCGLPDQSVDTLAIAEFYATEISVPVPGMHPPDGRTLVNLPNVLWTEFVGYEQDTDISAADVRLKFSPVRYVWNFSDGESLNTTDPGKPYDPDLTDRVDQVEDQYPVTHRFTDTGEATISLTVIINGQYSVNGGDWQPIAGSLSATSPEVPVTIYEARGELILPGN